MAGVPPKAPARHDPQRVADGVRRRERLALARLLTWIERGDDRAGAAQAALDEDGPPACDSVVLGVTGAPGAGKSSLVSALAHRLRAQGRTIGVVAVDPSSTATGGALLGDRVRMTTHVGDSGVFVRSMANRGQLGGLAAAVPGAVRAMTAYGFDWVVVETVGVGQVEIDVARHADCTLVLVAPGGGDDVQAVKAGIVEVADLLVVTKGDRPDAERAARELTAAVRLRRTEADEWRTPVLTTDALSGDGVAELVDTVGEHLAHAAQSGVLAQRRRERRSHEWRGALLRHLGVLADELAAAPDDTTPGGAGEVGEVGEWRQRVAGGESPDRVAAELVGAVRRLL